MDWRHDTVTFTINLPVSGMFEDQIEALRRERAAKVAARQFDAAHALHSLIVLAERGMLAFNTDTSPHFVMPAPTAGQE